MQRHATIATATAVVAFATSFSAARFWPEPEGETQLPPTEKIVPAAAPIATAESDGEIFTSRGIVNAAAGVAELSPEEREHMRYGDWAKRDPQAAFAAALAIKLDGGNEDLLPTVVTSIAETDPHLALELAKGAEQQTLETFFGEIFGAWPEDRLMEAAETLMETLDGISRGSDFERPKRQQAYEASASITGRWPEHDTAGLITWCAKFFDQYDLGWPLGIGNVIDAVAPRDVESVSFLQAIDEPTERMLAASYLASRGSFERGMQAIEMLPEGQRAQPILQLAETVAESDPHRALRFLEEQIEMLVEADEPGEIPNNWAVTRLERNLQSAVEDGRIDLADFPDLPMALRNELDIEVPLNEQASWVATLPDSAPAADIAAEIVENWVESDPRATSEWLATLAEGERRDQAIVTFTQVVTNSDPEAATLWAAQISEPRLRERFLRVALRRWREVDPESATTAIGELELSEIAVESLLRE